MAEYDRREIAQTDEDKALLKTSRDGLMECVEAESELRTLMLDDLKFATLDQWPADLRAERENDVANGPRPCLTVDQIGQYIANVANEERANWPSVKTRPVDDVADPETAKVLQGLIRHIEDQSSAKIAYETAGESAVTIGLGFFRVTSDYVSADSFDQELAIRRIPDPFSTYLSPHIMPDGSDAEAGWVFERVPVEKFKSEYPKAKIKDADFEGMVNLKPQWKSDKEVVVCEYFYKKHESRELLFIDNGLDDGSEGRAVYADEYAKMEEPRPAITGRRHSDKVTVHWCKHTGCEILEQRVLKGKYIPIVEVVGKEKMVEGKRLLWGLVRPSKDSLRAFNYWMSALTEKMALSPKAPWVGAVGQFASQGDKWDSANRINYAKLEYDPLDVNGNAVPAPRRTEPIQMEPAVAQLLGILQNNVKASLGMYKAAIGEAESQQSGKAILALQRESNAGTAHFGQNLSLSVAQCGRILVDLIPHYYDKKRVVRILGEDGKDQTVRLDPTLKDGAGRPISRRVSGRDSIYNLGVGRFDVTVTTGPGYTTSRQEAATVMTELANSAKDPASHAILQLGAIENSDFHGADKTVRRLTAMLPPQLQQEGDQEIPPQAMAKIAELGQGAQLLQAKLQEVGEENQKLKSGEAAALAKIAAQREEALAALKLKEDVAAEEARLARKKAEDEIELKRDIARAEHGIEVDRANRERAREDEVRAAKFATEQRELETSAMPQFMSTIEQMTQAFSQTLLDAVQSIVASQAQSSAQLIAEISKPKKITLGSIKRGADGITSASATVQ